MGEIIANPGAVASLSNKIVTQNLSSSVTRVSPLNTTGGTIGLHKSCNVATLSFNNIGVTSAVTVDTKIATLPVSPLSQIFFVGEEIDKGIVFFFIKPSGELYISGLTGANANKAMYGSASFIINT